MNPLWMPSASLDNLRQRALLMARIRQFFTAREYLEVETPIMARFGVTDVYLSNIKATFRKETYSLQTSPEYHMKRLLAAGSGSIFQLARVFRDDELGAWHNPEFTLLEWYRTDCVLEDLISEVNDLLTMLLGTNPSSIQTYQSVFARHCGGLDPFNASVADLKKALKTYQLEKVLSETETDKDQYLFLLMSHIVEPALKTSSVPIIVTHFPASQAALAEIKEGYALRFEVYFKGVELANGFQELRDPKTQKARFEVDLAQRRMLGLETPAMDWMFIEALEHGLPPCSGVAMGVDRLLALALQKKDLASVLSFDFSRA